MRGQIDSLMTHPEYLPCPYRFRLKTTPLPAGTGADPRLAGETAGLAHGGWFGGAIEDGTLHQGTRPGVPASLLLSMARGGTADSAAPGAAASRAPQASRPVSPSHTALQVTRMNTETETDRPVTGHQVPGAARRCGY